MLEHLGLYNTCKWWIIWVNDVFHFGIFKVSLGDIKQTTCVFEDGVDLFIRGWGRPVYPRMG